MADCSSEDVNDSVAECSGSVSELHGLKILEALKKQRGSKLCNAVLVTKDGQKIICHKSVLAANSEFLYEKINSKASKSDRTQIPVDLSGETVQRIVDYCYSGKVELNGDSCVDVLEASRRLGVTSLENDVIDYIVHCAQEDIMCFVNSAMFLRLPTDVMENIVGDVLIECSLNKKSQLLDVIKAFAMWAAVDHVKRCDVNMRLLERIKTVRTPVRQQSCPVSPNRKIKGPPRSSSLSPVQHSTPILPLVRNKFQLELCPEDHTLSHLEREMQDVIDELQIKQTSNEKENVKL